MRCLHSWNGAGTSEYLLDIRSARGEKTAEKAALDGAVGEKRKSGRTASYEMCTFFDFKYFIFAVDSGKYDCLQEPVQERKSSGDYRACDCGGVYQYADGGGVL